ncbi:MAG: hypothetical protein IPQ13_04280 [Holophagaceae bacterium]|nr:hypothetical protein [Holophagaceae bacterium]
MSSENKFDQVLTWVMDINPSDVVQNVEQKRLAFPGLTNYELASKFIESYSRKAAVEGFFTGLGSNPFVMAGTALADVAFMLRFYAYLTACIGLIANPKYFEDPDWKTDALLMLAGPKILAKVLKEAGVAGAKKLTKAIIKKFISKEMLALLKRAMLKWFGKKVTQKAILTKSVPFAGAIVGSIWNLVEIKIVGSRILKYHIPGESPA